MRKTLTFLSFIACCFLTNCYKSNTYEKTRRFIQLSGTWKLALNKVDGDDFLNDSFFSDSVKLPGSLDENKKGNLNKDTTDAHLARQYVYVGPAWFQKEVEIPANWKDKHVELKMERTKVTEVWIDSVYLGKSRRIFSSQIYDLSGIVSPGKHLVTIKVDNNPELVPVAGSHAYSPDTQTNWNGILGDFYLEAAPELRLKEIKVTPDIENKVAKVQLHIGNSDSSAGNLAVMISAKTINAAVERTVGKKGYKIPKFKGDTVITLSYPMGDDVDLWSEFRPSLYQLSVNLTRSEELIDEQTVQFGMRAFRTKDTHFTINGTTTFLRGKHEAAVFPETGYPPMDTTGWLHVFRIAQSYGINHYRFHSWCPPEAAFEAADICGIYLQPELPIWWGLDVKDSSQMQYLRNEGYNILDNYANHPSFVMFALGNEISQERDSLKAMVADLRAHDDRPLYAQGSNNRLWNPSYAEGDDYWTTFRTSAEKDDLSSDVRASISYLDAKEAGILNTRYPSTSWNYEKAIEVSPVPVIGHEIGQYQVYPNFEEIPKYQGVLKPWNLMLYEQRLKDAGMFDQVQDFFKASGALSVICYRADIEAAIRTSGFGGFQLLDLQDYPGQGTALVGLLDAFMDSKGLIKPDEFRDFCDDVVLLAEMDKYCWSNNEEFTAHIEVANYGPENLVNREVNWKIDDGSKEYGSGTISAKLVEQGNVASIGKIELDLKGLQKPVRLNVHLSLGDTLKNDYPLWVYPAGQKKNPANDVLVARRFDSQVASRLQQGGKVLLFPDFDQIKDRSVGGQFIPEFWNYAMFTSLAEQFHGRKTIGTMGILTDPTHPLFKDFPTEFHSNWQWWVVTKNSRPVILDDIENYKPVVQVVDNINRNHRLGLVFEFKVGEGKLLVCSVDPEALAEKPEAKQFYNSLIDYVSSKDFSPQRSIDVKELSKLLAGNR